MTDLDFMDITADQVKCLIFLIFSAVITAAAKLLYQQRILLYIVLTKDW